MTLWLFLVTTAAIIPLAMIATEASRLGIVGSLVGFCVASAFVVAQFVGHYQFDVRMLDKLKDGWKAELVVIAYYVAILIIGVLCALVTQYVARFAAQFG